MEVCPDIYALALGPLRLGHIYQANPLWPWYNYYVVLKLGGNAKTRIELESLIMPANVDIIDENHTQLQISNCLTS